MLKHHLANGLFRNNAELNNTHTSLLAALKWQWKKPKRKASKQSINIECKEQLLNTNNCSQLTWIGHATFLIQYEGVTILTDPVFSERASPIKFLGPKRATPPAIDISSLPKIDIVLISHDHYDHLDKNSVLELYKKQSKNPPIFIVPLKVGKWLSNRGICSWFELDWWESINVLKWKFTAVPVQHFSGRGLKQNNTLWAGWVMESPTELNTFKRFFFAGDTGYSKDFQAIGKRFGNMDVSLIPIGAYEPRWFMKEVHVNPDEAVQIHLDVKSKFSIAMHWGSFPLTDEPLEEPPLQLAQAKIKFKVPDQEFITLNHGEIVSLV